MSSWVGPNRLHASFLRCSDDGQAVIQATLCINDLAVSQVPLPCTAVASHQIYPFITVHPGMSVSLHEASTPSPLFTW